MTARRKPTTTPLGEVPFEHWHVLGPILWTVVAYAGAGVLDQLDVAAWYVAAVGAGVSVLAPAVAIYKRFAFGLMAATTAILTWTTATTPWTREPALVAAAVGVLFGVGYQALRKREAKQADQDKEAEAAIEKGRYVELLEKTGIGEGLKEARARTPFPAGKTVHLLLPTSGRITLATLKDKVEQLEIAAARAGMDVSFEFERGRSKAEVDLHVFERDVLAETIPLAFERRPKSISEPIQLGQFMTGEITFVTYREVAALMVGLKGQGKSNLINTHLAHLTGCTDAVVWMLDGKGGETVRPWIQSFLDLVTDRPAIDWVGWEESEFDAILLASQAVVKYRTRNKGAFGEPSPARPSVIVIVEEASVITGVTRGGRDRIRLAQDGVTQGRSSFVDWLFATQGATLDMLGSGAMKKNLDLRYGMGISDAQEARMIFRDGKLARRLFDLADDPKYRGTFLMQAPGKARILPAKAFFVEPTTIPGIAQTNTQWTASLDRETADHVHAVLERAGVPGGYYGRWDRIRSELGYEPVERPTIETDSETVERRLSGTERGTAGRSAVERAVAERRAARDAEQIGTERDAFEELMGRNFERFPTVEELLSNSGPPVPVGPLPELPKYPKTVPPILRTIMAIYHGHGMPDALPTAVILAELEQLTGRKLTPHLLGRLLGLCRVSPVQGVMWDNKPVRGYKRDDFETSIKGGSWEPGADAWTP